LGYIGIV